MEKIVAAGVDQATSGRLEGRIAVVTGAGAGLGFAIAHRLAADGARVVIADIADAAAAAERIGRGAIGLEMDVASEPSVAGGFDSIVGRLGAIDILINNAALSSTLAATPFEQIPLNVWRQVLDVNLTGCFLCCRAAAPHLRRSGRGRLINIASTVAIKGVPMMSHYVASKGGVIALTRSLANEMGRDGVTVNAVAPGYLLSEGNLRNAAMLEKHRAIAIAGRALPRDGHPADLVGSVAFLASDDAAFITGQILAVDGGSVYH